MSIVFKRLVKILLYKSSVLSKRKLHNVSIYRKKVFEIHEHFRNYSSVDTIDDFTVRLINKNSEKWNNDISTEKDTISYLSNYTENVNLKSRLKKIKLFKSEIGTNDSFTIEQINNLIISYFNDKNWNEISILLAYCINNSLSPSENTMLQLFRYHSASGDVNAVKYLQDVCRSTKSNYIRKHSNFDYFLGIAHWKMGNIENAFLILEKSYVYNKPLRRVLFHVFKLFINDVLKNSSEASNITLRKHVERFVAIHNFHFLLLFYWESCWLSEWFRDHKVAESLLEKYDFLQTLLYDKCSIMSFFALRDHNQDAVWRLLQILLKYDKKHEYSTVIRNLFDYQYKMDDYNGCSETIKNCVRLNVHLSDSQYDKYLNKFHGSNIQSVKKPPSFTMKF